MREPGVLSKEGGVGCPSDCPNTDYGTCPRCFAATGIGCPHGPVCAECASEQRRSPFEEIAHG